MLIHGKKVVLALMTPDDIPTFFAWATRSDSAPFWYGEMYNEPFPDFEEFLDEWGAYYFDGSEPERGRCFVIIVDDRAIGEINYNEIDREDDSVDFDIIIARDSDKGKGYGPDAILALMNYLFQNMDVKRFRIEVNCRNERAVRAYQKVGFEIIEAFEENEREYYRLDFTMGP